MISPSRQTAAGILRRALALAALVACARPAEAQGRDTATARRRPPEPSRAAAPAPGEAVTPQLVTVRPREPLAFNRQVLVPTYYDRTRWPEATTVPELLLPPAAPGAAAPAAAAPARDSTPATPRRGAAPRSRRSTPR